MGRRKHLSFVEKIAQRRIVEDAKCSGLFHVPANDSTETNTPVTYVQRTPPVEPQLPRENWH